MSDIDKQIQTYYYHSGSSDDTHDTMWTQDGYIDWLPHGWDKKCTCGCWTTFGKDCPMEYHSDWCELKEKK